MKSRIAPGRGSEAAPPCLSPTGARGVGAGLGRRFGSHDGTLLQTERVVGRQPHLGAD